MLKNVLPVYLVSFFGFLGLSITITVLTPLVLDSAYPLLDPTYTSNHRNILLGLLLFMYPLGQFIGSPFLGSLSDKVGRKPVLLASLITAVIFYSLLAYFIRENMLLPIFLTLFLAGLSEGNIAIAQSVVADVSMTQDRGKKFAILNVFGGLAWVLGPLMGGALADPNSTYGGAYETPYLIMAAAMLALTFYILIFFKETRSPSKRVVKSSSGRLSHIKYVFESKKLRPFFFINFLYYLTLFAFYRMYPAFAVFEYKLSLQELSQTISLQTSTTLFMSALVVPLLLKRFSMNKLYFTSLVGLGLLQCFLAVPMELPAFTFVLMLAGVFICVGSSVGPTLLSQMASEDEQGKVMGNNQALLVAAEGVSALFAGVVMGESMTLAFVVFGVPCLLAALYLSPKSREKVIAAS